jgi:hypothetical protein
MKFCFSFSNLLFVAFPLSTENVKMPAAAKSKNLARKKNVWRYQIFAISQRKFADDITSVYLAVKITKLKVCRERKERKKEEKVKEEYPSLEAFNSFYLRNVFL